ncbi:MAG: hypothetical protein JWL85_11 [Candidatus Saccharibacteria bacterium]|nr:hypothetical protein [Candidatus Saccharibacteria bacterium]
MLIDLFSYFNPHLSPEENVATRRKAIRSFKAKADAKRSHTEKFADLLTVKFGSIAFLTINATWFLIWILINTDKIPGIKPFDPYPFGFLTMVVSLEAIFLAIIVLISQNREARVNELREEVELQISTIAEGEVTKLINLVVLVLEKQGVKMEDDPELTKMLKHTDGARLQQQLEKELG